MSKDIIIEVFGIRDEPPLGGCDCGEDCGPTKVPTMGELFDEFDEFIKQSEIKEQTQVQFIDLFEDDLTGFDHVKPVIDKGYKLPLTFINKKPVFAGGIDHQKILQAVVKFK